RSIRLRLPNGQIARSTFKEHAITSQNLRVTRNVKLLVAGKQSFAEVRFYFVYKLKGNLHHLCMVSHYSGPDTVLYNKSLGAVYSCTLLGDASLAVLPVHSIQSVVAMVPH
ncbi:hypothetical protein AURDEDRAFT_44018, partial [Auricularia subglabra TFB-10046 SS5]